MNIGYIEAVIGANNQPFKQAMRESQQVLQNTSKTLKNVGTQMTMYLTTALTGLGVATFKAYSNFESTFTKIEGLVGVSAETIKDWKKEVLNISPDIAKSPKELGDALFFVASAGFHGAEAMNILTMAAKASQVGLGETKVVADLVTSAINAYGVENLNAAQATDILVAAVREGKAEAPALAGAMGQVLPIASTMGVTFDQVSAAVAGMTRTGTSAETAAMQLKNILASLLKPSDQAKEQLLKMGTSASILRKKLREEGLIATLSELKNLTEAYGEEAMATVFPNIRALSGVLDLLGSNAESNIEIFEKLKHSTGSLDEAFSKTKETVEFKLQQSLTKLKVSFVKIGQTVATTAIPLLQQLGNFVANLGDWFNGLSASTKKFIVVMLGITAAAGPVLLILGSLAGALSAIVSPVGLVVAGVSGLVVGLGYLATQLRKNNTQLIDYKTYLDELGGTTEEFTQKMQTQTVRAYSLFSALKKTNEGSQLRKILIKKINEEYGEYLPHLLSEKSSLEDIATAQQNVIAGMKQKLAIQFQQQKVQAILENQMQREQEYLKSFATDTAPLESWIAALNEYEKSLNSWRIENGKLVTTETKSVEELHKITGYGYDQIINILAQLVRLRKTDAKEIEHINALTDAYIMKMNVVAQTTAQHTSQAQKPTTVPQNRRMIDYGFENKLQETLLQSRQISQEFFDFVDSELINLDDSVDDTFSNFEEQGKNTYKTLSDETERWKNVAVQGIVDIAGAFGNMFVDAKKGWMSVVSVTLQAVRQIVNMLFAEAVAKLIAGEASKGIVGLTFAAVGIGALMGMWNKYVNSKLQGLATGGFVTQPGQFIVGEKGPELVTLPKGAAVTPNNMLNGSIYHRGGQLEASVYGSQLHFILRDYENKLNRMR